MEHYQITDFCYRIGLLVSPPGFCSFAITETNTNQANSAVFRGACNCLQIICRFGPRNITTYIQPKPPSNMSTAIIRSNYIGTGSILKQECCSFPHRKSKFKKFEAKSSIFWLQPSQNNSLKTWLELSS